MSRSPLRIFALASICACGALAVASSGLPQHQIPPGIRQADNATNNGAQVEKPTGQGEVKPVDAAKMRADAAELQQLAATVQGEIDQVAKGAMPKDMNDNLKKIEKLSKKLRSEIAP
jgi:hypothetical protein